MPDGYKPRVPLQRIEYPWLSTTEQPGYKPPQSVGGVNSVVLRPGIRKHNIRDFSAAPNLGNLKPSVSLDNIKKPGLNIDWKGIGSKMETTGKALAPFASNIFNAFRKPPKPSMPNLNSFTNLSKINLDDERARVNRATAGANAMADRSLPSNTAGALQAANLGTKLNALSSIAERETNANSVINNQQAQMDMQTNFVNNNKLDEYNDAWTERNIAQQREQSQNLANAGDKYIGIQNEKNKAAVDLSKTQMMSHAFDQSQVMNRLRAKAKAAGEADPLGRDYKDLDDAVANKPIFKTGGRLPTKRLS